MVSVPLPYSDRSQAGAVLGRRLAGLAPSDPVVVGLTRGGVPVAAEVAEVLGAPLDVLVVRKVGCPWQPELGIGAVAEGGVTVLDEPLIADLGLPGDEVGSLVRRQEGELERRVNRYRAGGPRVPLAGRTVVVVDDGLATGYTARAAVASCRQAGASRVVVAVPVGAAEAVAALQTVADDVVCLASPPSFFGVGQYYRDFTQVPDTTVLRLLERSVPAGDPPGTAKTAVPVTVACDGVELRGDLSVPARSTGVVVFAHGSGSSRMSPRNRAVAAVLNDAGLATLLLDLLTEEEAVHRDLVFDVRLLARRLEAACSWVQGHEGISRLPVGLFGASTGAAAALIAAADLGDGIGAVVSRGGRPDLAGSFLGKVTAPTLLVVGGHDGQVLELNRAAQLHLRCPNGLRVVPGATHLFEEPGALQAVAQLTADWFVSALGPQAAGRRYAPPA